MLREAVRVSAATFEFLWQQLRLGDLPTPLFVPSAGATVGQRRAVARSGIAELADLGLIVGRDEPDEGLVAALRLLARPRDEFYGWFVRADRSVASALVAVGARRAVLGVLEAERVLLSPVAPDTPARALLAVAPRVRAVSATSITVPAEDFRVSRRGWREDFEASRSLLRGGDSSTADTDVARLRALVAQPDRGRAQLFAAVRGRSGRRRRSLRPVYYLDTGEGRWMLHFTARRRGEPWLTAAPGSTTALARALYQARRELL